MKQVIQDYRSGKLTLQDVPPPQVRPGGVLVHNVYSLISAGTERGQVNFAKKSLLGKARSRPDLVRKVLDKARTEGPLSAYRKALQRLDQPLALGYSCAGTVAAIGAEVTDLVVGQRVACAGLGFASHAEVVSVPRNLCVPVPDGLDLAEAAYVTVGAIALEGVRVADARLGEKVVVIGLGLLGQLSVQLLRVAGCHVFGIDTDAEKVALALEMGAEAGADRRAANLRHRMAVFTDGAGADAVLVTAATPSSDPLELAAELARDRAAISMVGVTGMHVPRRSFYQKALELRMSRSYGPGRYDRAYEEKGQDYPIGYVRWTENRNMAAFLDLLAQGQVDVSRLTTHRFEIEAALEAYALIQGQRQERYIGVLLQYQPERKLESRIPTRRPAPAKAPASAATLPIGVIGAGAFATGILLPALVKAEARLRGIATQTGLTARSAADRFGFEYSTSDAHEILADPEIQAVCILTRPAMHADLVVKALQAGKHVFVEKPLAASLEGLRQIVQAYQAADPPLAVMTGHNRRHSPFGRALQQHFVGHAQPLSLIYRVNAGPLEANNWQLDLEQGGGRVIGECGHFFDLMSFIAGERPAHVVAVAAGKEDVAITVQFSSGSVGTLVYVTTGSPAFGKERLEVFGDGAVGILDDFRSLEMVRGKQRRRLAARWSQDKGHVQEIQAFTRLVARPADYASTLESAVLATLVTFQAIEAIRARTAQPVHLELLGSDA